MTQSKPTDRTRLKRLPQRGNFETETLYNIIDDTAICHIGIIHNNTPVVIPTLCGRKGTELFIHGSAASRLLKCIQQGQELCVTLTHIDGIVLARSAFHHSMNYRSVVIFGKGRFVSDEAEKIDALKTISEQLIRGRWEDVRPPNARELKQTSVIAIPIVEASAKIRTGPPVDDKEDYDLPVWAGVLPLKQSFGKPMNDDQLPEHISLPKYLEKFLEN